MAVSEKPDTRYIKARKRLEKQLKQREGEVFSDSGKVLLPLAQARKVARVMWEVEGYTMPQIAEIMCKSLSAVEKWSRVMKWRSKREIKESGNRGPSAVLELTRQKTIELLAERGMPPERAIDILIQGMTTPELTPEVIEGEEDVFGTKKQVVVRRPDHKTIHKFLHDYFVIKGDIGNGSEGQGTSGGKGPMNINVQVNLPGKKDAVIVDAEIEEAEND
jgi:transposase